MPESTETMSHRCRVHRQFCLVNESINPIIYVIIGGCAAGVLAVFIIVKVIKSGIKRRKKKAKLSDEEK